jgi:hypothetical protein
MQPNNWALLTSRSSHLAWELAGHHGIISLRELSQSNAMGLFLSCLPHAVKDDSVADLLLKELKYYLPYIQQPPLSSQMTIPLSTNLNLFLDSVDNALALLAEDIYDRYAGRQEYSFLRTMLETLNQTSESTSLESQLAAKLLLLISHIRKK